MAAGRTLEILGLVTARGGSKGLPGKNLRPLAGRPLIAWTIESARESRAISRVVVSTDDPFIAEVAREFGGQTPFLRPESLARDDSPHADVVLHALEWLDANEGRRPDAVMLLQPTSPLRTADDIDAASELMIHCDAPAVVSLVETHHHPYLARSIDRKGRLTPFMTHDLAYPRRQDLPPAYALNGAIYLCLSEALRSQRSFEPAGTIGYVMPPERSLQIDTAWDLQLCEYAMRRRLERSAAHGERASDPARRKAELHVAE